MKINWGTGIVLAFVAFIAFILYFVIIMSTQKRAEHDLVVDDYYKAELLYQQEIDAKINANNLKYAIQTTKTKNGFVINFPKNQEPNKITGTVSFYRPSNKQLDFNLAISLSSSHLLIPDKRLVDGRWDIKVVWQYNNKHYRYEENITY